MIPPISADCSKRPSECRRHNIGLCGGWAHPTSNCVPCGFVSPNSLATQVRVLFLTEIVFWKYRAQLPGFELPTALVTEQRQFGESRGNVGADDRPA